jgi:uncharacterized membrane protein
LNTKSIVFLALASAGIFVAAYHAANELGWSTTGCNITTVISCGSVYESGYTSVLGIPFYILGLIWFPFLFVIGILVVRRVRVPSPTILLPLLVLGDVFTLYLWYLEIVIIHAYCPICISMYVLNYGLTWVVFSTRNPSRSEALESDPGRRPGSNDEGVNR